MPPTWLILAIALMTTIPLVGAREIDGEGNLISRAARGVFYEPPIEPAITNATPDNATMSETTAPTPDANASAPATQTNETWPHNGSYAQYTTHTIGSGRGGTVRETFGNATWTFHDGIWVLDCSGTFDAEQTRTSRTTRWQSGAFEQTRTYPGDGPPLVSLTTRNTFFSSTPRIEAWKLEGCEVVTYPAGSSRNYFSPATIATWDEGTGLLQTWSTSRGSRIDIGKLVATDAPGVTI